MDPDACLKQIDSFLNKQQTGTAVDEWCEDLHGWLSRGGFAPDWTKYKLGTSYYSCRCVSMNKPNYVPVDRF